MVAVVVVRGKEGGKFRVVEGGGGGRGEYPSSRCERGSGRGQSLARLGAGCDTADAGSCGKTLHVRKWLLTAG